MPVSGNQQTVSVSIRQLGYKARSALEEAMKSIRPKAEPITFRGCQGRKWHLFLDQPVAATETCAIACGITILATCGEPPDSELMNEATRTLEQLHLPGSGWTSWVSDLGDVSTGQQEEALVLDTFYSLRALKLVGRIDSDPFREGLDWLRAAHNAAEGGWAFFQGDSSYTLPTSYALRILSTALDDSNPVARDVIHRGTAWLLSCQEERGDGSWGRARGEPSSAVHTALALMALMDAGFDAYSPRVTQGTEWLLANIDEREHISDYYITPGRDSEGRPKDVRAINHVNFPEGIILQGLLASRANLLHPAMLAAVAELIELQTKEGCWRCLLAPREQPIYAVMDACLALKAFVEQVERHEAVLEASERIQLHDSLFAEQLSNYEQLMEETATIAQTVSDIGGQVSQLLRDVGGIRTELTTLTENQQSFASQVSAFDSGLLLLKPLLWATNRARMYPWVALLLALLVPSVVLSAYFLLTKGQASQSFAKVSFILTILLIPANVIAFWRNVYRRRE